MEISFSFNQVNVSSFPQEVSKENNWKMNLKVYNFPTLPMLGYAVHIFNLISIQATKYQRNILFAKYVQNVDTFYNL